MKVFNMHRSDWTVQLLDGRKFDLYDKELDSLTDPADIDSIKRYRKWREDSIAGAAPSRSPTPMPWLRRMFYGLF
jgi:hypothetical protein